MLLAEVCARLDVRAYAEKLYDLALPYAGLNIMTSGGWVSVGAGARYLGLLAALLGRWEAARAHFEAALALNTAMGARPWLARTQHDYAAMLLTGNGQRATGNGGRAARDLEHARALLAEALATARDLGMSPLAARITTLQDTAPHSALRTPRSAFPYRLSEREVQVLRLLAAGKSNREIAAELIISLNTVLRHVSNILHKTGAANRVEAATYATRHELLR